MNCIKFMSVLLLISASLALFTSPVLAEDILNTRASSLSVNDPATREYSLTGLDYWGSYISDTFDLLTSPLNWERSDWLKAAAITGITIILYQNDQSIKLCALENANDTSDAIALFARTFGDGRYTLAPLTVFYAYGCWKDDVRARRAALLSIESFAITGLFTETLKLAAHRHRPNSGDLYDSWDGPGLYFTNLSFPSGHSSSAFAIATVIASEYGDHPLIPVIAYGLAGLTAWSRVNDNYHWTSDVFFGSALGYFTAKAIVKRHNEENIQGLTVFPVINEGNVGIRIGYQF